MEISERTAIYSIIVNLVIFIIKYISSVTSGSIALKAESFHTLADLTASLSVFIGLKIAKRKSKSFPYGLYKIENLISVLISIIIFYTGYEIILEITHSTAANLKNSTFAIISLLISILITFLFSKYEKKIGLLTNSPILLSDAAHIRTDISSNIIVLMAIISNLLGYHIDNIAAIIIIGFIAKTGFQIFTDGTKVLLDASIDYKTLDSIKNIIQKTPRVLEIKSLTGRNSGRFKFIEAKIIIKTNNLEDAHYITNIIEHRIKQQINNIDQILIHYEPFKKPEIVYAVMLEEDKASISDHFGESAYLMIVTFQKATDMTLTRIDILANPYNEEKKAKGILLAELLVEKNVDFVLIRTEIKNKGPLYVFSNSNIKTIITNEINPKNAFSNLKLTI